MSKIRRVPTRDLSSKEICFQKMHGPPGRIETAVLIGKEDGASMSGDLLIFEDTSLEYVMPYDDLIYVVEGCLELETAEETTFCEPGDVVWIPTGQELTFRSKGRTLVFCATYPVNWDELTELGDN